MTVCNEQRCIVAKMTFDWADNRSGAPVESVEGAEAGWRNFVEAHDGIAQC